MSARCAVWGERLGDVSSPRAMRSSCAIFACKDAGKTIEAAPNGEFEATGIETRDGESPELEPAAPSNDS